MAGGFQSYSVVPGTNTSINGINIAEGCPPSGVNDALRQIAADGRALFDGVPVWGGTSGGAANVQTITLSNAPASLVTGQAIRFIAGFANTAAAPTMNVNSLGAKTITRWDGNALQIGEIRNGGEYDIQYDGTNYRLTTATTGGVNAQTGTTYTVVASDMGRLVTHTNASAIAVTLPQATTSGFTHGYFFDVQNRGAGAVTITPATSTIDGATTLVLQTGQGARIFSDGANYFTQRGLSPVKAWVKFTISAGSVVMGNSYNVSSVTKNGTGDFTVNFTNALADANYSTVASCSTGTAGHFLVAYVDTNVTAASAAAPTTSTVRVGTTTLAGAAEDPTHMNVTVVNL